MSQHFGQYHDHYLVLQASGEKFIYICWASGCLSEISFSWEERRGQGEEIYPSINQKRVKGLSLPRTERGSESSGQRGEFDKWWKEIELRGATLADRGIWAHLLTVTTHPVLVLLFLLRLKCFEQLCGLILPASWNDLPYFQDWQHSRLLAVSLSALTVRPLYLWPDSYFVLFDLIASCLPPSLTLNLNFLSPRTVSYLVWDFPKCLTRSRSSIYVGGNDMWLRFKFCVLSSKMYKAAWSSY